MMIICLHRESSLSSLRGLGTTDNTTLTSITTPSPSASITGTLQVGRLGRGGGGGGGGGGRYSKSNICMGGDVLHDFYDVKLPHLYIHGVWCMY